MKNVFKVLILGLALLTITSCSKRIIEKESSRENVQIRFSNNGSKKIKNFTFDNKKIGDIGSGQTTKYYSFKSLHLSEYNSPVVEATAKYKGDQMNYYAYSETAEVKKSGIYTIDVQMYIFCGFGLGMTVVD